MAITAPASLFALINSTTLVIISLGIFYEAWRRFTNPPEVQSGILITVGLIAVTINLVTALLVRKGSEHDLNIRSTFLHLMGMSFSTVARSSRVSLFILRMPTGSIRW
jgi:cobalt-zinc-cadmium efflux system protein